MPSFIDDNGPNDDQVNYHLARLPMADPVYALEMNVKTADPTRIRWEPVVLAHHDTQYHFQTYGAAETMKVLVETGMVPAKLPTVADRADNDCRIVVSEDDGETWAYCDGPNWR